jgi:hypothetical protein
VRITLTIDSLFHQIDSTDPDLLARWIVEIFGRIPQIYPATDIRFQVMPSFLPDADGQWRPDWAADSRVLGRMEPARSPRELLAALAKQLDDLDVLNG